MIGLTPTFQELPVGESALAPFLHQTLSVMSTAQTCPCVQHVYSFDDEDNKEEDGVVHLAADSDRLVLAIDGDPVLPGRAVHAHIGPHLGFKTVQIVPFHVCEDLAVVVEIQTPDSGRSSCDHFAWRGLHLTTTLIVNIYFAIFVENSNVGQLVYTRSPNTAAQSHVFWGSSFAQGESLIHLSRSMLRSSHSGGQNANLGPIIPGPLCSPACGADSEPEGVVLRHSPHAATTNGDLQGRF